jgi:hypothetical protein
LLSSAVLLAGVPRNANSLLKGKAPFVAKSLCGIRTACVAGQNSHLSG